MSDFRFAEPQWMNALWGVLVFALALIAFEGRAGQRFAGFVSSELQAKLVRGPSPGQRYARISLLSLSGLFAVLALMQPQWGFEYVKTPRSSAELMIAIDVSRSMLAEDVVPNRLERAKAEVRDLLELLGGDHVGLIAFAGRASVLAPMTPDFGFFRLVLDDLGPHSTGRGGTRLEEPIRKAIQGFKATGDVSRVLLLITDGEDHDSFPIEAAREAAERGIRIIAIGFGSESGSEIPITDPRTGARTLLRDSEGEIVRSRLDGDTLREMALVTEGVYVPAGTGALDLESIYEQHIAGLMRAEIDDQGQVVRSEGFQWAVLASLFCLIASVLSGQSWLRDNRAATAAGLALALCIGAGPSPSWAQSSRVEPTPSPPAVAALEPSGSQEPGPAESESTANDTGDEEEAEEIDPRDAYNQGLSALSGGRFEDAEKLFEQARTAAGTDGEARYRASYGLGWAAAARADSQLEAAPEQALEALYRSGDHFREAVRLQPSNEDPRHNLEIILQRARVLADTLAKRDTKDIAEALDELIGRQREEASGVRGLIEQIAATNPDAQLDDAFRRNFRALSTQQRQILTDADRYAERIAGEQDTLSAIPEEERTPDDQIRSVQLEQLQIHLQRARERMGHSRRELRARRGERAYRRVSGALGELKRARDQLRDPVQILDTIVRDASELTRYTRAMSILGSDLPGLPPQSTPPPWLTLDYLRETQENVNERSNELYQRLAAGVAQAEAQSPPEPTTPEEEQQALQLERFMKRVEEAEPLIGKGVEFFEEALVVLEMDDSARAFENQARGLQALLEARERFLDLRRVIELAGGDQKRMQGVLAEQTEPAAESGDGEDEGAEAPAKPDWSEFLPALHELQQRNLARSEHIGELIEEERQGLPPRSEADTGDAGDPDQAKADEAHRQLDLASQILLLVQSAMQGVLDNLRDPLPDEENREPWQDAVPAGEQAVEGLDSLRRLFFTIIEHMKETARNQQELNDETEESAALPDDAVAEKLGPLTPRQAELARTTGAIAEALEEQSRQNPGDLVGDEPTPGDPAAQQAAEEQREESERIRRAAELTLQSQMEMEEAGKGLMADAPTLDAARKHQDAALQFLVEAIQVLEPPQQQEEQDQEEQQDQQQQQEQQGQDGQANEEKQPESADPSQLLQEVRDREAQRRHEKAQKQDRQRDTVEKDW